MQTRSSPNVQTLHRSVQSQYATFLYETDTWLLKYVLIPFCELSARLAKQSSIPDFAKLSKETLFVKLQEKFDMDRLLRTEARREKMEALRKEKKRKLESTDEDSSPRQSSASPTTVPAKKAKLNKLDPIMLEPIGKKKCFKFARPNGTIVRFNIESLVDFLLSSGDFHDPETRIPFSDADLAEIDAIVSIPSTSRCRPVLS
jgi:hypothetical protein